MPDTNFKGKIAVLIEDHFDQTRILVALGSNCNGARRGNNRGEIDDAILGFGFNIGPAVFVLYLVAFAAGILILIGALRSS